MSNQVLNWPRKLLTDEEKTIRATLARITSTAATATPIPHSMAPYIYVPVTEKDSLNFYIASLTNGGTIILDAGTYSLTSAITVGNAGVTIMGMGMFATSLEYTADANTDILTITKSNVTIRDLRISGATAVNYVNGGGAIGTGRGIVVDPTTTCTGPYLKNIEVANTGSWCIWSRELFELTDLGTGTSPNKDYGYPLVATTHGKGTVDMTLDTVFMSYPNSGGCFFMGYGGAAPRFSAIKTISYSFGTYTRIDSAGGVAEQIGQVLLIGVGDAQFDRKCVFQTPAAQTGGPAVTHDDTDATAISLLNCNNTTFDAPYFEVLSGTCAGGAHTPTAAGRLHWLVTSINTSGTVFNESYVLSQPVNGGVYYPLRIMHTPADVGANSVTWKRGSFFHKTDTYAAGAAPLPKETGDPKNIGATAYWDRDDFVFASFSDGEKEAPIRVEDCNVINLTSGKFRDPSTPDSGDGSGITAKQACTFSNANSPIQLARLDDSNPASVIGTSGTPDDLRSRWALNHVIRGGVLGYVRGTGSYILSTVKNGTTTLTSAALFGNVEVGNAVSGTGIPANSYVTVWTNSSTITINNAATDSLTSNLTYTINGTSQREGLWLSSHRASDFRQIPYIRTYTTEMPNKTAGDLWMKLSGTVVSSVYPTAQFAWYDGTQWQYVPTGLLAGDMPYYTAAGVSAILGIGNANYVMASTGTAPSWVLDSQRDVVDGLGNVVTSGGFVVVA